MRLKRYLLFIILIIVTFGCKEKEQPKIVFEIKNIADIKPYFEILIHNSDYPELDMDNERMYLTVEELIAFKTYNARQDSIKPFTIKIMETFKPKEDCVVHLVLVVDNRSEIKKYTVQLRAYNVNFRGVNWIILSRWDSLLGNNCFGKLNSDLEYSVSCEVGNSYNGKMGVCGQFKK